MHLFQPDGPWLTVLIFTLLFLVIFRRPLGWLMKLLARSALGLLGLPGLGLLFLFRWVGT